MYFISDLIFLKENNQGYTAVTIQKNHRNIVTIHHIALVSTLSVCIFALHILGTLIENKITIAR